MKLTIKDIAERCQVGKSTVSRVLNNDPRVKSSTRQKIQQVIDELNFQPNRTAQAMRKATEPVVAIIVARLNSSAESQTLSAILQALYQHHITPIIVESQFQTEHVAYQLNLFQQRQVDGVIVFGFSALPLEILQTWQGAMVVVARQYVGLDCVYYDEHNAMLALLEQLWQKGHRHIAYLGVGDQDDTTGYQRNQAYLNFCQQHTITPNLTAAELNADSAYDACETLFRQPVSALLCASSSLATGALKYLNATQRTLPLAYLGQNRLLHYLAPNVLSLDFGYAQAGSWAVELLLKQFNGNHIPEQRQVSFHLTA